MSSDAGTLEIRACFTALFWELPAVPEGCPSELRTHIVAWDPIVESRLLVNHVVHHTSGTNMHSVLP